MKGYIGIIMALFLSQVAWADVTIESGSCTVVSENQGALSPLISQSAGGLSKSVSIADPYACALLMAYEALLSESGVRVDFEWRREKDNIPDEPIDVLVSRYFGWNLEAVDVLSESNALIRYYHENGEVTDCRVRFLSDNPQANRIESSEHTQLLDLIDQLSTDLSGANNKTILDFIEVIVNQRAEILCNNSVA